MPEKQKKASSVRANECKLCSKRLTTEFRTLLQTLAFDSQFNRDKGVLLGYNDEIFIRVDSYFVTSFSSGTVAQSFLCPFALGPL